MKKILVPYDFSESSESALNYASAFAAGLSADLLLFHVSQYPVMNPELGLATYTYQDAKKDSLEGLKKIAHRIKQTHPGIRSVDCFAEMGDPTDEILKISKKQHCDLILTGISGHGSLLIKTLIGSNAVSVSKKSDIPVLIVPPGIEYKKPTGIAYACEYKDRENDVSLSIAKKFSELFSADLHILHVIPGDHPVKHTEVVIENYQAQTLVSPPHRTFMVTEKKAGEMILEVLKNRLADIIIIEPKKHTWFHNLIHHSVTTDVVFNSPVPVLTIHSSS